MKPDYWGYGCRCGAWSAVKNPRKRQICSESVNKNKRNKAIWIKRFGIHVIIKYNEKKRNNT